MKFANTLNKSLSIFAIVIVGFLLLAILFNPFVIVNAGERGVVMNFGKVSDLVLDEGLHPIIPIVTTVKKINVRVKKNDILAQAASKDLQQIQTDVAVNWHINPLQVNMVFQRVGDSEQIVNGIMTPAVSEIVKASVAKKTAEEIVTKRTDLKAEIDDTLKTRLNSYGILVDDVSLVDVTFSIEFSKAIEAKQIAEQEAKRAEFVALKAEQEAQADVNRAKGQAEAQLLLRANLTSEILQKQAIDKWDGHFPMVMGGNGALPFINLQPNQDLIK